MCLVCFPLSASPLYARSIEYLAGAHREARASAERPIQFNSKENQYKAKEKQWRVQFFMVTKALSCILTFRLWHAVIITIFAQVVGNGYSHVHSYCRENADMKTSSGRPMKEDRRAPLATPRKGTRGEPTTSARQRILLVLAPTPLPRCIAFILL